MMDYVSYQDKWLLDLTGDLTEGQMAYLVGSYFNLAKRHYKRNWEEYLYQMITKAKREAVDE